MSGHGFLGGGPASGPGFWAGLVAGTSIIKATAMARVVIGRGTVNLLLVA